MNVEVLNATANREWLRRKIKELDKQIEELSGFAMRNLNGI